MMSGTASGGAVKRQREEEEVVEEEDGSAPLETTVHLERRMLLGLVKGNFETLVWERL